MPFLLRPLLVVIVMALAASSRADDAWLQVFKKNFVEGCVHKGLERKHNPDYVKSFCNCSADVIAARLSESEIRALDAASQHRSSAAGDAAMKKIQDQLVQCKTKDGLKP